MSGDGKDIVAGMALVVSVASLVFSWQTDQEQTALAEKQTALAEEQSLLSGAQLAARADVAVYKADQKEYAFPDQLFDEDLKQHVHVRLDVTNEGRLQGRLDAVVLDNGNSTAPLRLQCAQGPKLVDCSTPMPIDAQTTQTVYALLSDRVRDLRCMAGGTGTELSLRLWDGTARSFAVPTGTVYSAGGPCAPAQVGAPGTSASAESTAQDGSEAEETPDEKGTAGEKGTADEQEKADDEKADEAGTADAGADDAEGESGGDSS